MGEWPPPRSSPLRGRPAGRGCWQAWPGGRPAEPGCQPQSLAATRRAGPGSRAGRRLLAAARPVLLRLAGQAQRRGTCPRPAERGVQAFGRLSRCCRLRGVLLRLAQLADRLRQPDQARGQGERGGRGAGVLAAADHGQEPGGGAQPVALGGPVRDLPVGGPRGPVVGVGGPAQRRVPDRPRRRVEGRGRRPGRIGGRAGSPRAAPDLLRGCLGLAGRVPVEGLAFRPGEPERSAVRPGAGAIRIPALAQPGSVSPAASRPPPYQRGVPSGSVWPGSATA